MPLIPIATLIVKRLQEAGFIAYFAGGWVRDFLMQHPSDDIDIATSASTEEIQSLFSKTIPVGIHFGILIVVEQGHPFEVASFRKEKDYLDGRRPTFIEKATPEEDALRRDFTINGMFYDPIKKKLFDFVGGERDIHRKLIRAIGNPRERFLEDRLRMMRAIRYATRFQFSIDPDTLHAISELSSTLLPAVAMERIWQEFQKMAQFSHFNRGLVELHRLGLLPTIFPQLKNLSLQKLEERLSVIEHFPPHSPPIVQLLELFPSESLEEVEALCELLKLSTKDRAVAQFLHHAKALCAMPKEWLDRLESFEWAKFYSHPHSLLCLEIIAVHQGAQREEFLSFHRANRKRLDPFIQRMVKKNPLIRATDLFKEGIPQGPVMGTLLREAERISVNHLLEDRHEVLTQLKKSALWPL
jgi:poly(A) polymerase